MINVDQVEGGGGHDDHEAALYQPHLNISHSGRVPENPETFRISLPCTGRRAAVVAVEIALHFNLTGGTRSPGGSDLQVKLTREKTCSAGIAGFF